MGIVFLLVSDVRQPYLSSHTTHSLVPRPRPAFRRCYISVLQGTENWAGPGNEATSHVHVALLLEPHPARNRKLSGCLGMRSTCMHSQYTPRAHDDVIFLAEGGGIKMMSSCALVHTHKLHAHSNSHITHDAHAHIAYTLILVLQTHTHAHTHIHHTHTHSYNALKFHIQEGDRNHQLSAATHLLCASCAGKRALLPRLHPRTQTRLLVSCPTQCASRRETVW